VSLSREQAQARVPGLAPDDFVVLFFGHLDVQVWSSCGRATCCDQPRIKFVVAGGRGGLSATDVAELERYKSVANVLMHDHRSRSRKWELFHGSACVALPYLEGTTSGVIKLAMAFDRPFIATDIGDFGETLRDWAGLLTAGKAPAAELAEAIVELRANYANYAAELNEKSAKYQWRYCTPACTISVTILDDKFLIRLRRVLWHL
jgi:glycosyltransferase involved in cell wall biosynthesis